MSLFCCHTLWGSSCLDIELACVRLRLADFLFKNSDEYFYLFQMLRIFMNP